MVAIFAHAMSSLVFFAARQHVLEKFIKQQSMNQFQSEPGSAEFQLVFHANIRRVDFDPLGFDLAFMIAEMELRVRRLPLDFRRPLHAGTLGLLEFAQPGDRSLPRPTRRPIGLDQRPVRLAFSLDISEARPDEHARMIDTGIATSNSELSTTTRFALFEADGGPKADQSPRSQGRYSRRGAPFQTQ